MEKKMKYLLILIAMCALSSKCFPEEVNVAITEFPPFVMEQSANKFIGFDIDLIKLIAEDNNWELNFVYKKNVENILDTVRGNKDYIGVSGISITADRLGKLNFSQPYFDSGLQLLINKESVKENIKIIDKFKKILPILINTFIILIAVLTLFAHIMWGIERFNGDETNFSAHYWKGIGQAYWWSIVTATTVGYGDITPKKSIGRIIAAMVMVIGIVWFGYFTGSVSSILTLLDDTQANIASMHNRKIGVKIDSTAALYLKTRPTVRVQKYKNIEQACKDVSSKKLYGVLFDVPTLMWYSNSNSKVRLIGDVIKKQQYGIAASWESPYMQAINISIIKFKNDGRYDKIYNKWFKSAGSHK